MKKETFIKYLGSETEFFKKQCVDQYDSNTVIIVPDTHSAIVVKDGQAMTTLDSGSHKIFGIKETKRSFFNLLKSKEREDHTVDVIYMSKSYELPVPWGTYPHIVLKDYLTNINVKIGFKGEFRVVVNNPRQFYLKIIGPRQQYTVETLRDDLSKRVRGNMQDVLNEVITNNRIHVLDIETKERDISKNALPILNSMIEESYGLKMVSFDITGFTLVQEDVNVVKQVLKDRENEIKERIRREEERKEERERRDAEKKEAKEIAAELERLDDKQFEREILLKELESKDYEKYLEVLKILAARNSSYLKMGKGTAEDSKASGSSFCPKCGHSYESGDSFCPGCGARVGEAELKCPKCGKINKWKSTFCSGCGSKL